MSLGRSVRRGVAALAVLAMTATSTFAQTCALPDDLQALRTRMLQTDLMVAALSCQKQELYNAFVTRFQPELAAEGKTLKAFFKREYGSGSTKHLDDFVTRLANESSLDAMKQLRAFCKDSDALFKALLTLSPEGLPEFIAVWPQADRHGILPCTQQAANP